MSNPIEIFLGVVAGIGIVAALVFIEMVAVDIIQALVEHNEKKKDQTNKQ